MARKVALLALCVALLGLPVVGYAQDNPADESEYSYGSIIEVKGDANQIVVSEYDWDSDAEVNVTYVITPDTEIENSKLLKDIPKGAYIDIEYVQDGQGNKVAKYLSVYEVESGEGE
ncbi:MAG: hypothetical protein ABH885_06740 [Candidatus Omnitrophota bacterium]